MGLLLNKELSNGITLNYHRIVSLNIITNVCNIIEVQSYIGADKRDEEKETLAQGTLTGEALPMNIYTDTQYINIPYDPEMNIIKAYEYLQQTPEWAGAVMHPLEEN